MKLVLLLRYRICKRLGLLSRSLDQWFWEAHAKAHSKYTRKYKKQPR